MRLQFAGRAEPGVGVAVELQVVDLETRLPVPAAPSILELLPDEPGIQPDLFQSLIQVATGIHPTVHEAGLELYRLVDRLREGCQAHGLGLLASGTHPIAGWRSLHITQAPQYETFIRRLQWVGRRAAVFGLKIHVGVPDGEKAIALGNSLATLVPLFTALSGSSPFWRGLDTGLASCRTRVIENIPNAGLPPNLLNFGEFQGYVKTLRAAETIESIADIWWDVRPNLKWGTIEFQPCDMPHTLREALALAGFAQAMVIWLLKSYEEGEDIPHSEAWIIRENKWRAARFGLDAEFIAGGDGRLLCVHELYESLLSKMREIIPKYQLEPQFADLEGIFRAQPGYARQRRCFQKFGLEQVPVLLMDELRQDQALS